MVDMVSSERGFVISGGFTIFGGALYTGLRLAFPSMIVPFGWALALAGLGAVGLLATIVFAVLWFVDAQQTSDRPRYVAMLQRYSVALVAIMHELENAPTDAALDAVEQKLRGVNAEAIAWMTENMGMAAAAKYAGGMPAPTQFNWAGEHSAEHRQKRTGMMQRTLMKIDNLNELLASDRWDDPVPLKKRKRTKEWKLLREETARVRADAR
jgi:hypothetical protein